MARKPRTRPKGVVMIMMSLMFMTIIMPMVGLAIDGTILYIARAKLTAAVDGGAIAAARSLSAGLTLAAQEASAKKTAEQFVKANYPNGFWSSYNLRLDPPVQVLEDPVGKRRTVDITAKVDVPLLFMRIFGSDSGTVAATTQAARRQVRMMLVLDRSSSMGTDIGAMKGGAAEFVERFSNGRDEVGLVVFGGSAIVAYPPRNADAPDSYTAWDSNFKTANPSVPQLIRAISSGSNTGMAEALWIAFQQLKKEPIMPGALNLIVLFTDGLPNGLVAEYNVNDVNYNVMDSAGSCTYKTATQPSQKLIGWMAQISGFANSDTGTTTGVSKRMQASTRSGTDILAWMSSPTEDKVNGTPATNCKYFSNMNNFNQDIRQLPKRDYFGNRTDGPEYIYSIHYKEKKAALNLAKDNNPYQVGLASWNATYDAARRIWNDPDLTPIIYTIGFQCSSGDKAPDQVLMKAIANVDSPDNPLYDDTKPQGWYVFAPGRDQLAAAFAKVASEVLRLTM